MAQIRTNTKIKFAQKQNQTDTTLHRGHPNAIFLTLIQYSLSY